MIVSAPTALSVAATTATTSWEAWATLGAALLGATLAGWSVVATKRVSAREHTLARFQEAINQIESGVEYRVEFGQRLLAQLRTSSWLSDEDRLLAAQTLRAYNEPRSEPGGAP